MAVDSSIEMQPLNGHHNENMQQQQQEKATRPSDLASFDSTDTWASCNPFPSAADLSGWSPVNSGSIRSAFRSSGSAHPPSPVVEPAALGSASGSGSGSAAAIDYLHDATQRPNKVSFILNVHIQKFSYFYSNEIYL